MKIFQKITSAVLAAATVLSLTACHGKDEVAVTIDGVSIKSGLYLCALLEADSAARSKVDSEKSADNTSSTASSSEKETDYYSQTIDGQKYVDYVKANTLDRCKEFAFYQKMADEKKITLTDEEKSEANSYAEYYWNYYSTVYEANGVSLNTYKQSVLYNYYANAYFRSIYGEGGEKAVDSKTISETLTEKYALVYKLTSSFSTETSATDKTALKNKLESLIPRLKNGEDFKTISDEFNGTKSEDTTTKSTGDDTPKDSSATIVGDSDTNYSTDLFDDIAKMKKGEMKVMNEPNDAGISLYVKLDITEDPYYLKTLKDQILVILKQDEFNKAVKEKAAELKTDENKYATNRFKVKKLVYPEQSSSTSGTQA